MNTGGNTTDALCQALMREICKAAYGSAKRQVNYLRLGVKSPIEEDLGRYVIPLASLHLTPEQLDSLEKAFVHLQEHLIAWLFSIIDGSTQPPGWPSEVRLVNVDTNEVICPGGLEWSFGLALAEYRSQMSNTSLKQTPGD